MIFSVTEYYIYYYIENNIEIEQLWWWSCQLYDD